MSLKKLIYPLLALTTFLSFWLIDLQNNESQINEISTNCLISSLPIEDTVYTLTDRYIEISLKDQRAYLIKKNGERDTFKISSGNPNIPEGISTPTGIFTVQNKSALAISKQFNDAKLFNWVGINGNVGLHGLEGNSYYRTLGVRPVSHGCMRISREDGEKLMKSVKVGVPALIHNGAPARVIAFADSSSFDQSESYKLIKRGAEQEAYMRHRLKMLYSGYFYYINDKKVYLDGETVLRGAHIESGAFENIASKQKFPLYGSKSKRPFAIDLTQYTRNINIPDSLNKDMIDSQKKSADSNEVAPPTDALK